MDQCCPTFVCTRAQFTDAYGGAGATTLLLLLLLLPLLPPPPLNTYYYYYYYYYHHHLIRTTSTTNNNNNNNNNKIIRNVILTKSFVNIIILTYNTVPRFKEILWRKYLTVLRHSKMFFVLKFELILIIGLNNVLTEGARKVYRGRRVGQGCLWTIAIWSVFLSPSYPKI
jgi:Ca2+/Na+ antiporter